MNWVGFAIGSAFFAGLTAILGKLGVEGLNIYPYCCHFICCDSDYYNAK